MKKELFSFLLLIFLISPAIAISTDLKEIYQPQETIIIEVSGNILQPILNSQVQLFRNHIQVAFQYDIKKISGRYYLWGIAPLNENNYTLKINNIAATQAGSPVTQNFQQNFSVSGELISYSINPGFKVANLGSLLEFSINLNKDQAETITSDFPSEQSITLNPGANNIILDSSSSTSGFRKIQIGMYSIPVLLNEQTQPGQSGSSNINFFPLSIKSTLLLGETQTYPFKIINYGETDAYDFAFLYNIEVFEIAPSTIQSIPPNSSVEFTLTLKTQDIPIFENISLTNPSIPGFLESFTVNITYTENQSQTGTPYLDDENYSQAGYYCSELLGKFCTADEICSGETVNSLDGSCCVGTCETNDSSGGSLAWIGWLIGGIILIVLIIIGIKYKKSKSQTNPLNKKINPVIPQRPIQPQTNIPKKP